MPPKIGSRKLPDSPHSTVANVMSVMTCSSRLTVRLSVCVANREQSCSMRCSGLSVPPGLMTSSR